MRFNFDCNQTRPELDLGLDLTASGFNFGESLKQCQAAAGKARVAVRAGYERWRRCTETKPDGKRCKGWAVWHADEQKCIRHLSPEARTAHEEANRDKPRKTPRPVCDCEAYPFPHRPNTGYCIAPQSPIEVHLLPAGHIGCSPLAMYFRFQIERCAEMRRVL